MKKGEEKNCKQNWQGWHCKAWKGSIEDFLTKEIFYSVPMKNEMWKGTQGKKRYDSLSNERG